MAETTFLKGIRLFKKKDNQPAFVLATGVITPDDLNAFCIDNPGLLTDYNGSKQLKIQVLLSKDGNPYISVDTWKPQEAGTKPASMEGFNDDIPADDSKLPF